VNFQEFSQRIESVTKLTQAGRLKESEDGLYQLILSDISDLDKSEVCASLADVYDRMGNTEEALTWFDKGIALEQGYSRFEVTEKKAEYLSQLGHSNEAIRIYESLLKEPFLRESDKMRVRKAIQNQLGRTLHGWK
jgi:tetratricopeptide (TPR) repeat protein